MVKTQRSWRLNPRAAIVLAVLVLLCAPGYVLLKGYQEGRIRRSVLEQVRQLRDAGKVDLALGHLGQYVASRPRDLAALDLQARLLAETAQTLDQMMEAARVCDRILRQDPDGLGRQETRRRLAELYIRYSDAYRLSGVYEKMPEQAAHSLQYHTAEVIARQLIQRGARDPAAHRLLAMALEGQAVPSNERALTEAIHEYEVTLSDDPGDAVAAERLAWLYQDRTNDPTRAERVLENLIQARPDAVEVRLVRYRHFAHIGRDDRAASELEAATRLAPEDLSVRLMAAEHALQHRDMPGARHHIAQIPAESRDNLRVRRVQGLIALGEDRPDEAIDHWRKGLLTVGGTDAELTWCLAYTLLELGRVSEAQPLLIQYRRLVGDESQPRLRFLQALQDQRTGRTAQAIKGLEEIQTRIDEPLQEKLYLALGRCHEALGDEVRALEAYRRICQLTPKATAPRIAAAALLLDRRPDEAITELEGGLAQAPTNSELRIAVARAYLRQQARLPADRRSWAAFDRALGRAAEAAPDHPAIALMRAERRALDGAPAEALAALEEAARRFPRDLAVWTAWADGLARAGQTAQALQVLERASDPEAAGDRATLRIARARLLVALGRGRAAHDVLVRDADRLPSDQQPLVWKALGDLLAGQGDVAGARQVYAEWVRLRPDDPRPRLALLDLALNAGDAAAVRSSVEALRDLGGPGSIAWRLGRVQELLFLARAAPDVPPKAQEAHWKEAEGLVNSVVAEAPKLPAGHLLQGQVLERRNRPDEAIAAYQRAWNCGAGAALPRLVDLLARRHRFDELARLRQSGIPSQIDRLSAQAFLQLGDEAQASRFAEQAAQDQTGEPGAQLWQAKMLELLSRFEKAEAALRAAAERQPGEVDPWLILLRFQAARKQSQAVEATITQIKAQVKTDQPELLEARCRWTVGDRSRADKAFAAARTRWPDDPQVHLLAANYYEETGRPAEAETCLRHILSRDPNHRQATRRLAVLLSARAGDAAARDWAWATLGPEARRLAVLLSAQTEDAAARDQAWATLGPEARRLAVLLSARAGDAAAWDQAWATLGPEAPGTEDPEDRLARAIVLSHCPDPVRRGKAIDLLEALVADLPAGAATAVTARDHLVRLLLGEGRTDRACQVAAVSAAPASDPYAIAVYAEALRRAKRLDEAERQLDLLAALNPGDAREALLRAWLVRDRARPGAAAAALERAYLDRGDAPGAEALGREVFTLLVGMGPKAAPVAERVGRRLAERHPAASWMPAQLLAQRGRHDEALKLCQSAVDAGGPDDLRQASRVAVATATAAGDAAGLVQPTEAILEAALRREPGAPELLLMLAMLRHRQGRYDEEVRLYRQLLAGQPDNDVYLNNLAWALCEGLHQPSEALTYIDKLVQRQGRRDAGALDTRGVILTRLGRLEEAIKDLEEAVRAEPTGPHYYHLARAYSKAGRGAEFQKSRDLARQAGLTLERVEPSERAEWESLMQR